MPHVFFTQALGETLLQNAKGFSLILSTNILTEKLEMLN
jgi:hypothetical protein